MRVKFLSTRFSRARFVPVLTTGKAYFNRLRAVRLGTLSACLVLCAAQPLRADVALQWQQDSLGKLDEELVSYLGDSGVLTDFYQLLQQHFHFDPDLTLVIGTAEGPDYVPGSNQIRMPYDYFARAIEARLQLEEDREAAVRSAVNVVEFTLYHLLGHAILGSHDVDEDELAEAISTWAMVKAWPNGAEQWLADLADFAEISQKVDGPLEDYWHAHSVFASRERAIQCWLLGLDAFRVEPLLPAVLEPRQRRTQCQASWKQLELDVLPRLEPFLKDESPLATRGSIR